MRVSVVVPSLNAADYIREAVEGVLSQDGPELEVLIQDGGSSDRTLEIVRAIDDGRVSVVSEPDGGLYDALNRGIRRATGEWVLCLNADDSLAPQALARVAPLLSGSDEFICGDFGVIDAASRPGKLYLGSALDRGRLLRRGCYLFTGSMLARRALFERFGYFDDRYRLCGDYDFLLRIAGQVVAAYVPDVLAYFRLHGKGLTDRRGWAFFRETLGIRREHGAFRNSTAVPAALNQLQAGAYLLTRPLWLSSTWRRVGPGAKRQ